MKRGKSQYSVEFLITYGWALLIIGIIVGAIYTFGWFDPGNFLPQKCHFYGQVGCRDYFLNQSEFKVSVVNNFGVELQIKGLKLFVDGEPMTIDDSDWTDSEIHTWKRGAVEVVNVPINSSQNIKKLIRPGERIEGVAVLQYFYNKTCNPCWANEVGSGCNPNCVHNATGRVLVKVAR